MFKDLISTSSLKKNFQKSLLVSSIALLAACGSDDESNAIYSGPVNEELITLSADTSQITIDAGNPAAFYADEEYGTDERNLFDIYLPESTEPTGLIIYIHGGGFYAGSKELAYQTPDDINAILAAGVAFATINYSLLTVPGINAAADAANDSEGITKPLSDIREALQYIRYNAKTFNIDPRNVSTYGVSAGAVSSLWLAYSDDMAIKDSTDPIAQQSTRIVAAGAIETQGSLDLVRWEEILTILGVTLEQAADLGGLSLMESFYGIAASPNSDDPIAASLDVIRAETGDLADLRATLDLPALIDSNDAPVYLSSTWETFSKTSAASDRLALIPGLATAAGTAAVIAQNEGDLATAQAKAAEAQDLQAEGAALAQQLIGAFLHFPTHPLMIKVFANEAGAEVVANIPALGQPDQTQQAVVPFLLGYMQ